MLLSVYKIDSNGVVVRILEDVVCKADDQTALAGVWTADDYNFEGDVTGLAAEY